MHLHKIHYQMAGLGIGEPGLESEGTELGMVATGI